MNLELFATTGAERDLFAFEARARNRGFLQIAGIDEAGRGPLAGPVVAAAVILPHGLVIPGLDDSKKLTPQKRETLIEQINAKALAVAVGIADHSLIDRINILQATLSAMLQAVSNLQLPPDYLLIDGISKIQTKIPQQTVKKGDSLSASIAAASIVAKVTRDRLMDDFDRCYPGYGFSGHKGYGCAAHLAAIAELGPCEIHRKTFRGVREHLDRGPAGCAP
ncbi:ribonuclease HII [Geobacter pelophilus]|jgi:ribonuclease HII|uniref:Ribonuclease HII n=1 Tax=Geoanaerobacter pelophilus TaxID=60036 RepID=A0AAW4KZ55_9BACT|nr:ribonuclease HII [Geoanaerobacter pelophilus]MBT0663212.1 ribonuclease HII [Geoanaerobacter pelophilus]